MRKNTRTIPAKKIIVGTLILVILMIAAAGIQWATYARPPLQEAIEALESDDLVAVTQEPWLTFSPVRDAPKTGFVFYPGGRIDPRGYASLMHLIASQGYLVVVPEMPINMAVFNPNIADEIIEQNPNIQHWVIAGHSIGGTMAAQFTNTHRDEINGLMIWASYPAGNADLSDSEIPVVSIYGSLDPRVNDASVAERKVLLPPNTHYIEIEGGGHHQFGAYLINPEEHQAAISRRAQHEQILQATLDLLDSVSASE
jgi:predicted esterase